MNSLTASLNPVLQRIGDLGIVPVVVIDDPKNASALGQALKDGGLPCAEITFRTAGAREAIVALHEQHPDVLVGAGTVLTVAQAQQALEAGAAFIVAPGLNREVVTFCTERDVPVTPGIMTPSDIETALGLGLTTLKFFPAEAAGGLRFLKAVSAPYKMVRFVPTGGIDRGNFLQYLNFPPTLAVGGSWMVKSETIREGHFDVVRNEVAEAVRDMIGLRLESPETNDPEIKAVLQQIYRIIRPEDLPQSPAPSKQKSGTGGEKEVVRLSVRFLERALARLKSAGVRYNVPETAEDQAILDISPGGPRITIAGRQNDERAKTR